MKVKTIKKIKKYFDSQDDKPLFYMSDEYLEKHLEPMNKKLRLNLTLPELKEAL